MGGRLATCEVPEYLPSQGRPKVAARVLVRECGDISEGFVKEHCEERAQAEDRNHLKCGLEEIPVALLDHMTPNAQLTRLDSKRKWRSQSELKLLSGVGFRRT